MTPDSVADDDFNIKGENKRCWTGMFETAVIADISHKPRSGEEFLDADFSLMIQLAAVENPVMVNNFLVPIGYSTALVPMKKIDDQTIIRHFDTAEDDS